MDIILSLAGQSISPAICHTS